MPLVLEPLDRRDERRASMHPHHSPACARSLASAYQFVLTDIACYPSEEIRSANKYRCHDVVVFGKTLLGRPIVDTRCLRRRGGKRGLHYRSDIRHRTRLTDRSDNFNSMQL